MAIREQGYRHYEGTYSGHALRWWTITRFGIRTVVGTKARLTLVLVFGALAWLYPMVMIFQMTFSFGAGFGRGLFYEYFNEWQWLMGALMTAIVGSGLISNDLSNNALHVYLSKPLRRADYLVGKAGIAATWVASVTLVPALVLYGAGSLLTNRVTKLSEPWEVLGELLVFQFLVLLVYCSIVLAISAISRKWSFALIGWIMLFLLSDIVAGITSATTGNDNWMLLSLRGNLFNVAQALYEQPATDPSAGPSVAILIVAILAATTVYVWRILRLEVAE